MQQERHSGLPIWIRCPRAGGVDHFCGLARSKLYELASRGRIKSVSLKEPHQIRGTRLFNLPSILRYIESKAIVPNGQTDEKFKRRRQLENLADDLDPDVAEPAKADLFREYEDRDDGE